ncbi:class F sortase [Streptomyces mutabilis]|uniref:class F sortase n=1 Tax=Streptomyces mutabilis TaxID=67332 RepID=UPI000A23195E|nr:class F sortase [Streptomyces sp. Alain-F2R5]MDG9693255.1 class F sortase [Streptomyces sp. DH17]OSC61300.1 class F sortase [Streptomyces sp. 4F]PAN00745.1 class F sortase [Streptomyces sp. Alain-F2R5]
MTPRSGRALAAVVLAAVLAGCGGQGSDAGGGRASGEDGPARPATTAPPAQPSAVPVRPLARSAPVGLRIPAIGVDTPVMRLGLASDGTVEVPPVTDDDLAGWYRHSPTPGQIGPSVVLGHVTVGSHGDGVFRRLARLHRGDRVEARLANGTAAEFAVTEVRTVAKADFPTDDVYGDVDRPELRLITCGGPRSGDEYRDNVIVFAELTATTGATAGATTSARSPAVS